MARAKVLWLIGADVLRIIPTHFFWISIMGINSFCGRHPLIAATTFLLLVFGSVALAGTKMQLDFDPLNNPSSNNPHQIPQSLNPNSKELAEEIRLIKSEIREASDEPAEVIETIHSIALRGFHGQSQTILDYTTGTSN